MHTRGIMAIRIVIVVLAVLETATMVAGQTAVGGVGEDEPTIQVLLQRIERLEAADKQLLARVEQLEKAQQSSAAAAAASALPEAAVSTGKDADAGQVGMPDMDVSQTLLNIRGFGDFGLYGGTEKGKTTSFSLGQLNLFITSDISEKFKFLTELVFEVHPNNEFEEDLERVLLEYSANDYLKISGGRYHTAIGYYNTAYHHTTWFQTTTDRPFLFQFEDEGGILPIHNVGISATGQIPSGKLGLHYVAEIGNGRRSNSLADQPVQNVVDENNHKAVNLALFARPESVRGLQVGFSAYRDVLYPTNEAKVGESIWDTYAVLERPKFEWLNEGVLIRHAPQGMGRVFNTPGFYTQISRRFGSYRPYFRYQYVNAPDHEPIFPGVGLRTGPTAGLRYDVNEAVALKLQYDHTSLRRQEVSNALALQVGFTF